MLPDTSLLYFYEVVRQGSVRLAAEQLHISASAISRMIKKVEHRFRAPLFERRSDGMVLTPAGEVLARHLAGVFMQIQDAEAEIAELQGIRRGEISVHCADVAAQELAPQFLSAFHRQHPQVTFNVRSASTEEIVAALLNYSADIGITYNMRAQPDIESVQTFEYALCALVAPSHPLAKRRRASLLELSKYRLAAAERCFGVRQVLDQAMTARGIEAPVLLTTNSLGLLRGMACEGEVITVSSRFAARTELASGRLVAVTLVEEDALRGTLSVCKRAGRELSRAAQEMIRFIVAEASHGRGGPDLKVAGQAQIKAVRRNTLPQD
jgi:DNA-binding transcriptional LysR family regulator